VVKQVSGKVDMDTIVSLCKRRGYIFQSSEIYGGMASCWDYGPLGVELKRNIKDAWWRSVIRERDDVVGLDAAILMHPEVWAASGHLAGFADPFSACKACGRHFRADQVWQLIWDSPWWQSLLKAMSGEKTSLHLLQWAKTEGKRLAPNLALVVRPEVTLSWIADLHVKFQGVDLDFKNFVGSISTKEDGQATTPCPVCGGELSEPEPASLMLETYLGPVKATAEKIYLRPETAQGIFVNFENVLTTSRKKLPFGIAQIGKSFRNEITPGNFIFRTREFEQMEMQFFVKPGTDEEWFERWREWRMQWHLSIGLAPSRLRWHQHGPDELAHYAKAAYDIEYEFPFGWNEIEGVHNRSDFDLGRHQEFSGKKLEYFDQGANERYLPFIVETSAGADRVTLTALVDAYREEQVEGETRVVLGFHPSIAPIKAAVLPLVKKDGMPEVADRLYHDLKQRYPCFYDDSGAIGRRYRRMDEAGTPFCVTVDGQTLIDQTVTVRHRDAMTQDRLGIDRLGEFIADRILA
jgi:glycyl-tRNA synthetase